MKLVLIPPGEFQMGATEADVAKLLGESKARGRPQWYIERLPSEAPKHHVRITKPFYLGTFEVTQAEYKRVMGTNPSKFNDDPTRPVEQVTWDDASTFCRKLAELREERTARAEYRLPTEAEWEYACRAGTIMSWYSCDDEGGLQKHAWFMANAGGKTHPVGQKTPNAWGLYDMHGNVFEWCLDRWGDRYYSTSPTNDPTGALGGSDRLDRGGSYDALPSDCRAAYRIWDPPSFRAARLGFRVALTPSGT
jgi:formylglycine-generating enzyme required for sulfatase activity